MLILDAIRRVLWAQHVLRPHKNSAMTSRKQKVHSFLLPLIPHHKPTHTRYKKSQDASLYSNLYQRVFGGNYQICHEVSGIFRSQLLEINGWSIKSLKSIPSGSGPKVGGEGRQGRICKELQVFLMWSMYGDGIWLQAHFLIRKKKNQVVGRFFSVCARGMFAWMMLDGWVI